MAGQTQQEISLFDLWQVLVQQKKVILSIWVVCTLIGAAYAFLATPIYKVETYLLPPSQKNIQPLNVSVLASLNRPGSEGYDSESVYRYDALFMKKTKLH